jgi:hypothetical protein
MGIGIVIVLAIFVAIVIRLLAGGLDHDRVREYVESRGGSVVEARWAPFGPGWFGDKHDRIYEVRYLDRDGHEHHAHCKTSLWSGVYFTDDEIVCPAAPAAEEQTASLEAENRRLREELERLKGGEN